MNKLNSQLRLCCFIHQLWPCVWTNKVLELFYM